MADTPIGQLPANELISTVSGNLRIQPASGVTDFGTGQIDVGTISTDSGDLILSPSSGNVNFNSNNITNVNNLTVLYTGEITMNYSSGGANHTINSTVSGIEIDGGTGTPGVALTVGNIVTTAVANTTTSGSLAFSTTASTGGDITFAPGSGYVTFASGNTLRTSSGNLVLSSAATLTLTSTGSNNIVLNSGSNYVTSPNALGFQPTGNLILNPTTNITQVYGEIAFEGIGSATTPHLTTVSNYGLFINPNGTGVINLSTTTLETGLVSSGATTYTTGTISTSGSSTTVTGSGTTFTTSMVGGLLTWGNGKSATIVNVNSGAQLTIDTANTIAASTPFVLYYGQFQVSPNGSLGVQSIYSSGNLALWAGNPGGTNTVNVYGSGIQFQNTNPTISTTSNSSLSISPNGVGVVTINAATTVNGSLASNNVISIVGSTGYFNNINAALAYDNVYGGGGTIAQSGTTVTGTSTNFTSALVGGIFVPTGYNPCMITAVASTTSMTVTESQTISAGTAFTIGYAGVQFDNTGALSATNLYAGGLGALNLYGSSLKFGNASSTILNPYGVAAYGSTYSTGTISQSGYIVNGTSTTFTSSMVGGLFVPATGKPCIVVEYNAGFQLNVSVSQTISAGTSYTIYYGGTQFDNSGTISAQTYYNLHNLYTDINNSNRVNIGSANNDANSNPFVTLGTYNGGGGGFAIPYYTYSTGTITSSGNTITGSGTSFISNHQGGYLLVTSGTTQGTGYLITNVANSTTLTLSGNVNASGATYTIYYGSVAMDSNANMGVGNIYSANNGNVSVTPVPGNSLAVYTGYLDVATAGYGLKVKEGSNCKQGTATLSSGTVVVSNTSVTSSSRIFLTAQDNNSTGALRVSARTAGTSFTITSSNSGDSGVVGYEIFEPG